MKENQTSTAIRCSIHLMDMMKKGHLHYCNDNMVEVSFNSYMTHLFQVALNVQFMKEEREEAEWQKLNK